MYEDEGTGRGNRRGRCPLGCSEPARMLEMGFLCFCPTPSSSALAEAISVGAHRNTRTQAHKNTGTWGMDDRRLTMDEGGFWENLDFCFVLSGLEM